MTAGGNNRNGERRCTVGEEVSGAERGKRKRRKRKGRKRKGMKRKGRKRKGTKRKGGKRKGIKRKSDVGAERGDNRMLLTYFAKEAGTTLQYHLLI